MKTCPEGSFTSGHLWMAALCGAMVVLVAMAVLRNAGMLADRRSDG